ncbi:MAG: molybdopterin dinucleotide binding domain-containing protein, partial [Vulcanimicrobiaceae bacterium]
MESPVKNAIHPDVQNNPAVFVYDKAAGRQDRFGTSADFPYIATTYRVTEHEHFLTQQVEHLVALQPEPFIEIPSALAQDKGIKNGDYVWVRSKRGQMHVRALVTNRVGQLDLGGTKVYQVGIPIHWGFVGIEAEKRPEQSKYWLANALTPFVGDANSRTPETKAFLVNIEKA